MTEFENTKTQTVAIVFRDWSTRRYAAIRAICDFAKTRCSWRVVVLDGVCTAEQIKELGNAPISGAIFCLDGASRAAVNAVSQLPFPCLNIGTPVDGLSSVGVNSESVASLTCEHLAKRGLASVCFVSTAEHRSLATAMSRAAADRSWNYQHLIIDLVTPLCDPVSVDTFSRLMTSAKLPTGIVTSCDTLAVGIMRVAKRARMVAPEQFVLMSCRDSTMCAMPADSITAVVEPTSEMGSHAARTMDRMLSNQLTTKRVVNVELPRVDAGSISVRVSTADPNIDLSVSQALTYIRENADRGIHVSDVVNCLDISRVTFERRFRDAVGRSPGAEIRRVRLEFAKRLLVNSQHSIANVGQQCGFNTPNKFSTFFRKNAGYTPTEYRQQNQIESTPENNLKSEI